MKTHITTLVYARRGDAVALLQRRKAPNRGLWSPPGGKIEPGETPLDNALRELAEETGLGANAARLAAVVSEIDPMRGEAWLMFVFRVDAPIGDIGPGGREGEPEWVDIEAARLLPSPPADEHIMAAALNDAPGVTFLNVRFVDGRLIDVEVARDSG